jgi:hypothetical protein
MQPFRIPPAERTAMKALFRTALRAAVLSLMLPFAAARAADNPAKPELLRPYLDNQTLLVVHIDTAKIDSAAFEKFVQEMLDTAKVTSMDEFIGNAHQASATAGKFLTQFTKLGGRHVYTLFAISDIGPEMAPGAILIPLEAGADPKAMIDFLKGQFPPAAIEPVSDNLLLFGDADAVEKLKAIKAQPRPEIESALTAAPASALSVIAAPSDDARKMIATNMPQLPPQAGGGDTGALIKGLKTVTVSVDLPPAPAVSIRIDAASPDAAHQISDVLAKLIEVGRESPPMAGLAQKAHSDPTLQPAAAAATKMFDDLAPKIDGSAVAIKLSADQLKDIAPVIKPPLERAQSLANKAISAANLRGLSQSCIVWANENNDAMPDHFGRLLIENQISPKQLVVKGSGTAPLEITPQMLEKAKTDFAAFAAEVDKHCDYIYLGKGATDTIDSSVALAYEKPSVAAKDGLNVAFMDAHAEFVRWDQVPQVFKPTNDYLKKMKLSEVDVDALLKARQK